MTRRIGIAAGSVAARVGCRAMAEVAVVTDSTCYLPADLVAAGDVQVVSLYVTDASGQRRETDIDDYAAFYAGLRDAATLPTTSQPSVGDFLAVYEPLAASGREIVSIHLSGGISGTVEGARQAAAEVARSHPDARIEVVDSTVGAGALGLVVLAAGARARADAGREEVAAAAQAWLGGALKIKPILTLDREITPVERVRTSKRAFERMVGFMRARQADGADGWVVQHVQATDVAERLVERGRDLFGCEPVFVSEVGPVIGAHVGPGLVGFGGLPRALLG